ncbi:hypothetical protein ASO20_00285 [Mycoplasma sp. (ex Biomphalaria glabrata)]|uniref:hypothetical protein n=1 Tax=Mycoplasma sp. (ex Biomphalaria glabrata) TaxID=1749074 RepID=UPI00073ADD37|nr:hypothetical protein [Mycoplasma sp. (ex Biomphalaria glabrata)]ALV23119.1 hypothetical protein ASO20_00285 [Mycoplasma sp. (ex Biomphalaria glabrata)]
MNNKIKLLTIFSTLTTAGLEPVSDLANAQITKDGLDENNLIDSSLQGTNNDFYVELEKEKPITGDNPSWSTGYVPTTFNNESSLDNGSFTTIKNKDYLVVPFWAASIKRPHFDSFTSYSIDSNTQQLSVISSKIKLGYDVTNKIMLPPQIVGEQLVTFYRDVDLQNPYGKGEWNVGVTNIKTGEFTNYSLSEAISTSTNNFRNVSLMVENFDSTSPNYYLAAYEYTSQGKIVVLKLNNFDPTLKTYDFTTHNSFDVIYPNIYDVMFGNGFATTKRDYNIDSDEEKLLLGWNNLFQAGDVKPIIIDYSPYANIRGYWLFQIKEGLMFANLGDNKGDEAYLQMGIVDANNKAIPTATFSFTKTDQEFDFYQGTAITFSFSKGYNEVYYLIPSGVKSDSANISSLPTSSKYFSFNVQSKGVTNLNSYDYKIANNLFSEGLQFLSTRINYISTIGIDLVTTQLSTTITQTHFRRSVSPVKDEFLRFLQQNLFFVDLTEVYNKSATSSQKEAIEKIARWIGKEGDYTFTPTSWSDINNSVGIYLPTSITTDEINTIISDFVDVQATAMKEVIQSTYDKWISTIEGTPLGHQWGWYNQNDLKNMFPTYIIGENGLTYDRSDIDLANPKDNLRGLINEFHSWFGNTDPIRMIDLIDKYLNPVQGSDIEIAFNNYKSIGKKQFDYYSQEILLQFSTFYYGFPDQSSNNNVFWNYYLDQTLYDPIESPDKLVERWKYVMQDSSWDNHTVVEFLIASKVWNGLAVDEIAGKDANAEKYEFSYTTEFQDFKDININSFSDFTNDFYSSFLKTQYFGYIDPNFSFDSNRYFLEPALTIITEDEFINLFPHKGETYRNLSNYYNWKPGVKKYNLERTEWFNNGVLYQKNSLISDISEIINLLKNSYYGFDSLKDNIITTNLLYSLEPGKNFELDKIYENFYEHMANLNKLNLINSTMSSLKNDTNEINNWINDQKSSLTNRIDEIINLINSNEKKYYGWLARKEEDGFYFTNLDKLLINYPETTDFIANDIVDSILTKGLPTGVDNSYQLYNFLETVTSDEINEFLDNQVVHKNSEIDRIVNLLDGVYYGYTGYSGANNDVIGKFLLFNHQKYAKITSDTMLESLDEALVNVQGYKTAEVKDLLSLVAKDSEEFLKFKNIQFELLVNRFEEILSWIRPTFIGFFRVSGHNKVSRYIFGLNTTPTEGMDAKIVWWDPKHPDGTIALNARDMAAEFIMRDSDAPYTRDKYFLFKAGSPYQFAQWFDNEYSQDSADVQAIISENVSMYKLFVEDFYDNFLSKEYFGYFSDDFDPKFNFERFFDHEKKLISKEKFLELFPFDGSIAFFKFFNDNYYDIFPFTDKFILPDDGGLPWFIDLRKTEFLEFVKFQKDSLKKDFEDLISRISNSYYGYTFQSQNILSKYLFSNLKSDQSLDASSLTDYFYNESLSKLDNFFTSLAKTKDLFDFLKNPDYSDLVDWKNDQKTQLAIAIDNLISQINKKGKYYGWVTNYDYGGNVVTSIDKLLFPVYFKSNNFVGSIFASFFDETTLPEGISYTYQIKEFIEKIDSDDIDNFVNNQNNSLDLSIKDVMNAISDGYFGYAPSESLINNRIVSVILWNYTLTGEQLSFSDIRKNFVEGVNSGIANFPLPFQVNYYLLSVINDIDAINSFKEDQVNSLTNQVSDIISWIKKGYYGFTYFPDNTISKYFFNKIPIETGTELEPSLIAKNFIINFPIDDENFPGKWATKNFFGGITETSSSVVDFIKSNRDIFDHTIDDFYDNFLKSQYFGYDDLSLSDKLDVSSYFTLSSEGLPEILSKDDIISTFLAQPMNGYANLNKFYNWRLIGKEYSVFRTIHFLEWEKNQEQFLYNNINKIVNTIYSSYWGYGELSIPSSILDLFFDTDKVTVLEESKIKDNIFKILADKKYQIFSYLNTGKFNDDLNDFLNTQMNAAKQDLIIILDIFNKYYYGYDYDFSGQEPFVGAKNIALFLISNGNMTNGIPNTYEDLFNNFRLKIIGSDLAKNDGKDYTGVSTYLKSLYSNNSGKYEPISELLNYQKWSEQKLKEDIYSISWIYLNNYYGYALGNDATTLNLWFGTSETSYLTIEQLESNFYNHFISLNRIEYKNAIKEFSQLLGTDLQTEDSILGRDFKSAMSDINLINQLWRDNYYGVEDYTGRNWFQYTYSSSSHNWTDITNRIDILTIQTAALSDAKFVKDFLNSFKNDGTALIAFKSYQNTELLKLLQPIIDFYNLNYMGYSISESYILETNNNIITNGWSYDDVISKITSIISKTKDTNSWEYQYIKTTYDANIKQQSFYDEQMNALTKHINDDFIGQFIANNYYGYNFNMDVSDNIKKILSWQNSSELNAIWDTTTWNNNTWENTNASTYKIFSDINSDHTNNLKVGKTFKNLLDSYISTTDGVGAEFINYQISSLKNEVTALIATYRSIYMGYTNESTINLSYLPGMSLTNNGNFDWNLDNAISSLISGNFQDSNRLVNGNWIHNNALDLLAKKATSGDDNLKSIEDAAFDADVIKIVSEYKKTFRGFFNDVNGNKLTFKTLGGDDAIKNGVFISDSTNVSADIFNSDAFKKYVKDVHLASGENILWESNIIAEYDKNKDNFKNEQNAIFSNYLTSLSNEYFAVSKGYYTTLKSESLKYSNLPGWKYGIDKAEIDLNLAIDFFDVQTYNQMKNPDKSAKYRLSYDAIKLFNDNLQNYANEQNSIANENIPVNHQGFKRKTQIFDFLANVETFPTWNQTANYRGNYKDPEEAKKALDLFLNQKKETTSLADLNNISSNWYSSFEGGENDDWNNTSLKHSFMFFGQYGLPLEVFYDPANPNVFSIAVIDANTGEYIIKGVPDSMIFSPNSKDGDMNYEETLVITQGKKQVTYKVIPANNDSPYDQLLFTVADTTNEKIEYSLAQKITITQNNDDVNTTESTVSIIDYDTATFSYSNESFSIEEENLLKSEYNASNTIKSVNVIHHATRTHRNTFVQIAVGNDAVSELENRANVSVSNASLNNKIIPLNDVIHDLPTPPTPSKDSSGLPAWLLAIIVSISIIVVVGIPLAFFMLRKKNLLKNKKSKHQ